MKDESRFLALMSIVFLFIKVRGPGWDLKVREVIFSLNIDKNKNIHFFFWFQNKAACILAAKLYLSRQILLTDRRATFCSVLKVVYFLRNVWGYISSFPYTICSKASLKVLKNSYVI
jgi:hypothetical protein